MGTACGYHNYSMTWEKKLVAIRSLRSAHHAKYIEPTIIEVTWTLGKRCNYDCSYCSPAIHDWVSPHIPLEIFKDALSQLNSWAISQNKTFNINFTGGEPFVHPDIVEILKMSSECSAAEGNLGVVSNGSMPLKLYQESLKYTNSLHLSLHLNRSDEEIQTTLDKIIFLNSHYPDRWINLQVMCLPGKFEFIENTVVPLLESNNVKFTLVKIRPWLNEAVEEFQELPKRELLKTKFNMEQQTLFKKKQKLNSDARLTEVYNSGVYYSAQELDWFQNHIPKTSWQNLAVWNTDLTYFETNSELMIVNNRNQFKGWTCFVGVDSLLIDFDGLIYRGSCQNDGPIGRLGSKINFINSPTTCKKNLCLISGDNTIRKSHPDFLHLITKS